MGKSEDTNDFTISGPFYHTTIDWTNSYYITAVLSSLVNGVYTLQEDSLEKREGSASKAKPWWESFDFTLHEILTDDDAIYGAVFKYRHYHLFKNNTDLKVPCYVIAFRGTVLKRQTCKSDVELDLKIISNQLHLCYRSYQAVKSIRKMVKHNESGVWLAGHSLGAALVSLAGKTMAKDGFYLESHMFNPPLLWSIPSKKLPGGDIIKGTFQFNKYLFKATILPFNLKILFQEDAQKLASWKPCLYLNPADIICSDFVDYFKLKAFMSKIRLSKIETCISMISIRNLLFERKGESLTWDLSKDPLHIFESADVTINNNKPTKLIGPHDIQQWWQAESTLRQEWESIRIRPKNFWTCIREVLREEREE